MFICKCGTKNQIEEVVEGSIIVTRVKGVEHIREKNKNNRLLVYGEHYHDGDIYDAYYRCVNCGEHVLNVSGENAEYDDILAVLTVLEE